MTFQKVNPKQSFPDMEEKVLAFWKENETFKKSIENRPAEKPYRFYDGPPFITGTPHYGSLLSSIVKDIVPRYHTMQGKRCERVWGWDCHGLPIEEKVQKKLGLTSNKDIEEVGIKKFIEECYTYTRETSAEWDWYIEHIGRWVDMENCYKTMDQDYMESVMWVFKSMWDKGMVYKGQRVSLYSWKLSTPISNFEVAMDDSYETVSDPAITVMFPLSENKTTSPHLNSSPKGERQGVRAGDFILAWTTTPWTIPAHMSMALNANLAYSRVKSGDEYFILATARVETVFKGREYEIVESFMGKDLIGLAYEAPFGFYQGTVDPTKNHRILHADFITDTDGTGIGHQAPEFGDVDFQLAKKEGVHISAALDNAGKYTEEISDYEGLHYREANDVISEKLKEMGRLFKKESINHRVAMCPRSGTPLIYKAQDSWFIDIQSMKGKLIAENEGINWQPAHLKHGQFLKSMESAPDWCISRTRYWGTPMPIWKDSKETMEILGSKKEIFEANKPFAQLEEKDEKYFFTSGEFAGKELDLHRPFIDEILAVNKENFVAKKVLGIHGYTGNIETNDFWKSMQSNFAKEGIEIELPQFSEERDTFYHEWEAILDTLDFSQYDTIISHSLGTRVICEYLLAKNIKNIKRLILVAPTNSGARTDGTARPKLVEFYKEFKNHDLSKLSELVEEVIAIHSKDDTSVPFEEGKFIAEQIGASFVETNALGHFNGKEYTILESIVKHGEPLVRIPEVLDVWMDSGSMPYAQEHYPFQNEEKMKQSYPADFIVEYIGQVRAWFYVMHVVGVALFDMRAFSNVITTGIVMGSDGRKMSKSLSNYPDPKGAIQQYGADAIRFYMANSPLLTGGNMDFKEEGILEVIKKVILPLWNTYSFFTTYANIDKFSPRPMGEELEVRANPLDTWIISETNKLVADVENGMETYEITDATRPIVKFMDQLTNWYIRRSRKRFWKSENDGDKLEAYETLYEVLITVSQVIAPFMPFVSEEIYKNLTGKESVHLTDFPKADTSLINVKLNENMALCQKIINLGLSLRTSRKIRVRQPLQSISIGEELSDYYKEIIKEELNLKEVNVVNSSSIANKICKPNGRLIGPKFGKSVKNIMQLAKAGNYTEVDENTVKVGEFELVGDEFEIAFVTDGESDNIESRFGMVIKMDLEITPELKIEGHARDIVRHIQEARKEAGYEVDDRISLNIVTSSRQNSEYLKSIVACYPIENETLSELDLGLTKGDIHKIIEVHDFTIDILLKK